MKKIFNFNPLLLGLITIFIMNGCNQKTSKNISPPVANKIKKELSIHGHTWIDNYFWMNQRENPEVIAYLEAENDYTKKMLEHTGGFQQDLFDEIVGRIKQEDESVPYRLNGYYYYTRYEEGKEYPLYCRKKESLENSEEILLNVNQMARGYSFYNVGGWDVSFDNSMIAFSVDTISRRKYTIYVKNLKSGEILPDKMDNTSGAVTWANDNKTLYYVTKDETLRPEKIHKHQLGTKTEKDEVVFHEQETIYGTFVYKSKSRQYIIIGSYSTLSSEFRFLDAGNPDGEFKVFHPREKEMLYSINHYQDKFYIRTNEAAKNFRLMETPVTKTGKEYWAEVIPHREDVLFESLEVFNQYLAISEKINGLDQIRIINLKSGEDFYMEFDDPTYMAYLSQNPEFDTDIVRFSYSSLTTPKSVYDYNMATKQRALKKRTEVLGGFDPENYTSERLFATAEDGTKVPISLVYRKGLARDGNNPLMIKGYGAYGYSSSPYFSPDKLSLLDRGFVYAIAHVRGGQELGRQWYEDGKLLKKKNTFTDFIACTEHLINKKYTNPEICFAIGGSAGGLLMGTIINLRPDLYKGIIAAVPFVDVITTMLDESIPLTTSEYDEWGNPNDETYYNYILSYSPYDQVEAKDYPAMLVTTGLHDSQVQYWEPAKWVARLRDLKTDDNMLLLFTQMDFGHGGASGRFEKYRETALEYTFVLNLIGITE